MSSPLQAMAWRVAAGALLGAVLGFVAVQVVAWWQALGPVPAGLGVWWVKARHEWPADQGHMVPASLRVFRLPARTVRVLHRDGTRYLRQEATGPVRMAGGDWSTWGAWSETPLRPAVAMPGERYDVRRRLCSDRPCAAVDDHLLRDLEEAVNTPGSFTTQGRAGLLVVSPYRRRVYFVGGV